MEFPSDTNGDVLRRMFNSGMDLSLQFDIDFWHLFEAEDLATLMLDRVRAQGLIGEVSRNEVVGGFDVRVIVRMVPTHEGITDIELELQAVAEECGGIADGWGVLQE
jgi:hypothetical protein